MKKTKFLLLAASSVLSLVLPMTLSMMKKDIGAIINETETPNFIKSEKNNTNSKLRLINDSNELKFHLRPEMVSGKYEVPVWDQSQMLNFVNSLDPSINYLRMGTGKDSMVSTPDSYNSIRWKTGFFFAEHPFFEGEFVLGWKDKDSDDYRYFDFPTLNSKATTVIDVEEAAPMKLAIDDKGKIYIFPKGGHINTDGIETSSRKYIKPNFDIPLSNTENFLSTGSEVDLIYDNLSNWEFTIQGLNLEIENIKSISSTGDVELTFSNYRNYLDNSLPSRPDYFRLIMIDGLGNETPVEIEGGGQDDTYNSTELLNQDLPLKFNLRDSNINYFKNGQSNNVTFKIELSKMNYDGVVEEIYETEEYIPTVESSFKTGNLVHHNSVIDGLHTFYEIDSFISIPIFSKMYIALYDKKGQGYLSIQDYNEGFNIFNNIEIDPNLDYDIEIHYLDQNKNVIENSDNSITFWKNIENQEDISNSNDWVIWAVTGTVTPIVISVSGYQVWKWRKRRIK